MILAVIPARYQSSRFPGKPLAMIGDRSMIRRVYELARRAESVDEVVVATDDERILKHVHDFGGRAVMTRSDHVSGTDRVAEVANLGAYAGARVILNVQGDEPFLHPGQLDAVVAPFTDPDVRIATLARRITDEKELLSPNVVKVVRGPRDRALYFSRHPVPYLRDVPVGRWIDAGRHLQHLGLYAFRPPTLRAVTALPQGQLEADESLEQLRWLQAGYGIHVGLTTYASRGIDTPEDLRRFLQKEGI